MEAGFTHFDSAGNAIMVDISDKEVSDRVAVAQGSIITNMEVIKAIKNGTAKKGDVLGVARVAGIMAVKQTGNLIPMCHMLPIDTCSIDFILHEDETEITAVCSVKTTGKTGAEMEALTGVSVALLTIYDMCKAIDKKMNISNVHLVKKTGGKSGEFYA